MSTYSSNLYIELIGTGEQTGTWGSTTNNNFQYVFEEAIVGRATVAFSDADVTLTPVAATTNQTFRNVYLNCTGTNTASRNLIVPNINKNYIVENNTTGGFNIVVKTAAGTGITVPNGYKCAVYVDGTNVVTAFNYLGSALTLSSLTVTGASALNGNNTFGATSANTVTVNGTITSNLIFTDNTYDIGASGATRPRNLYLAGNAVIGGSTTLSGGTANGVLYLNGSKVATTGSALTFDGTNFVVGGTSANAKFNVIAGTSGTYGSAGLWLSDNSTISMLANNISSSLSAIWTSGAFAIGANNNNFSEIARFTGSSMYIGFGGTSTSVTSSTRIGFTNTANSSSFDIGLLGGTADAQAYIYQRANAALIFATNNTEVGRFSSAGQLSIGTTGTLNYGTRLSVLGTTNAGYGAEFYVPGSNSTTKIAFANDSSVAAIGSVSSNLVFYAPSTTEVGRFSGSGQLLIGTTAENYTASIITVNPITTNWSGTIGLRYNVSGQTNAYYKGMTGTSIASGTARGLHIFNYDQDSNAGINFYPNSYAGQTANPAMTITSANLVGIGTTTPGYVLDVSTSARIRGNTATFYMDSTYSTGQSYRWIVPDNTYGAPFGSLALYSDTQGAYRLVITSSGQVLIGATSAAGSLGGSTLQVGSGFSGITNTGSALAPTIVTSGSLEFNYDGVSGTQRHGRILGTAGNNIGGAYSGGLAFEYYAYNGSTYQWYTGLSLDSGGKLYINSTGIPYSGTSARLNIESTLGDGLYNITSAVKSTASQGHINFVNNNGNVGAISTSGSSTSYATSSDYRLKNTITLMTGALEFVRKQRPVSYKWNADDSIGFGYIAHWMQEDGAGNCVTGEKDAVDENGNPKYQGIDTSFMVAPLNAAINELANMFDALKSEFDAYKASHP